VTDNLFSLVITVAAIILVVALAAIVTYAIFFDTEEPDPMMIYHDRNLEVRAVCTVDSGVIVTTVFNARIAGDSVSSVRMTPGEVAVYCVEGGQ
jgi:hypothetical protein